jgi:glycosyltransferase involved in cell wall biosynthesis
MDLAKKKQQNLDELTNGYKIPLQRVTPIGLGSKLIGSYFPFSAPEIINLQSGLGRLSPNLVLMRRLISPHTAFVVTLRGPSHYEPYEDPKWQQEQLAYSRFVSAIIVPSEMERQVRIQAGISEEKVFAVPNIMDAQSFQSGWLRNHLSLSSDRPIVLFCGRLTSRKSPIQTIEAFKSVIAKYPKAVLVMAGDGALMPKCQEIARNLGHAIHFLGHVSNVSNLYADADVFVGPSTAESFGRIAMEAALSKTPMVLGQIRPWTDYFQSDKDCQFVDPQDAQSIAQGIIQLLDYPQRSRQLAENAFTVVKANFGEDGVMKALSKAYQYALAV